MDTSSSTTQTTNSNSPGSSKKGNSLVIFIILFLGIVCGLSFIFYLNKSMPKAEPPSQNQTPEERGVKKEKNLMPPQVIDENTIISPVNSEDTQVKRVALSYEIVGNLTQLKDTEKGKQLILDINNPEFPPFVIEPETQIAFVPEPFQFIPASINDLKVGQEVRLVLFYYLKVNSWFLNHVQIPGERQNGT